MPVLGEASLERFREEIAFALENVSYLGDHLMRAGIEPEEIRSPADLERIPTTEKAGYRAHFPHGVLARGTRMTDRGLVRLQSSGTEGDRAVSVVHRATLLLRMVTCLSVNPRLAFMLGAQNMRNCRFAAPNCSDVECANPNTTTVDRLLDDGTLVLPVYHDLLTTPSSVIDRALAEVVEYRPLYVYADPIHLAHLVSKAAVGPAVARWLSSPTFAVLCSYSMLTRVHRKRLTEFFPEVVPLVNVMAMSEFGFVGLECPLNRLHLDDSDYYLELLSAGHDDGGEITELCVTTLGDRVAPRIRYMTGDLYRPHERACACGSRLPAVDYLGRRRNTFWLRSGRLLTPDRIDSLVGDPDWLLHYQLQSTKAGRFVLYCVADRDPRAGELDAIRERLVEATERTDLRIELVPYIATERGGKFVTCKTP